MQEYLKAYPASLFKPLLSNDRSWQVHYAVEACCEAVSCAHVMFACARFGNMRPLVRLIILWILIVSLPLQGSAASVKLPCTMAHGSITSQNADVMDDCDEPATMIARASQHASNAVAHQGMPCDQGSHQEHPSCRACSACCVGASAPPPFEVPAPAMEHFEYAYISLPPSITGWIPSRLDRPPRL